MHFLHKRYLYMQLEDGKEFYTDCVLKFARKVVPFIFITRLWHSQSNQIKICEILIDTHTTF